MAEQIEKAFQKQHLFQNAKSRGKKVIGKDKRWYKDVGLGFKTPSEAINGTYIDKKCPFTGDVSIRGRILTGRVVSTKMTRTIIRRDYLHYIPKYRCNRPIREASQNLAAHASPAFRIEIGDTVTVGHLTPEVNVDCQILPHQRTSGQNDARAPHDDEHGSRPSHARSQRRLPDSAAPANIRPERRPRTPRRRAHTSPPRTHTLPGRQARCLLTTPLVPTHLIDDHDGPHFGLFKGFRSSKDSKDANGSSKRSKKGLDGGSPATDAAALPAENTPQGSLSRATGQDDGGQTLAAHPDAHPNGTQSPSQSSFAAGSEPGEQLAPGVSDQRRADRHPHHHDNPLQPEPVLTPGPGTNPEKLRTIDIDDMINRLLEVGYSAKVNKSVCLKNNEITAICQAAREVFLSQPTLIELSPPVKIVGDVHGQYSDLIRLFEMCGFRPRPTICFWAIMLTVANKVSRLSSSSCATRSNTHGRRLSTYSTVSRSPQLLPPRSSVCMAAIPSLHTMDDIKRIQRPTDVPDYGLLNDLLWSDPSDMVDWRTTSVVTLVTVFSAPNYCGEFDNYGACMSVSEDLLCAFELLKPLDGPALRKEMTKVKRKSMQQQIPAATT
ncbi:ribosomal S17 N-terminal [Ceratobasidium sp. AG-Ba]|nr:ribosomal S17 N-terminal [Ceratobasidium sp. AG-Ba]